MQSGLKVVDEYVKKLREIVNYVDSSDSRLTKFVQAVVNCHSDFSGKPVRWNVIYSMLRRALEAKEPLIKCAYRESSHLLRLGDEDWETIENICDFLEPFYEITMLFSGSEYPTTNLYFANIVSIEKLLYDAFDDPKLKPMADSMLGKFEEYWSNYSVILSIAVVLDPRYKLQFVKFLYSIIYSNPEECAEKVKVVLDAFSDMYEFYAKSVFPALSSSSSVQRSTSSKNNSSNFSTRPFTMANIFEIFDASAAATRSIKSDMDSYLNAPLVPQFDGDFDVLQFWKSQQALYPILACMARDVLAIPITSVASESTFSMGGRTFTKYRSSLVPKNVEVLITTQNWILGYEPLEEDDELEVGREVETIDEDF